MRVPIEVVNTRSGSPHSGAARRPRAGAIRWWRRACATKAGARWRRSPAVGLRPWTDGGAVRRGRRRPSAGRAPRPGGRRRRAPARRAPPAGRLWPPRGLWRPRRRRGRRRSRCAGVLRRVGEGGDVGVTLPHRWAMVSARRRMVRAFFCVVADRPRRSRARIMATTSSGASSSRGIVADVGGDPVLDDLPVDASVLAATVPGRMSSSQKPSQSPWSCRRRAIGLGASTSACRCLRATVSSRSRSRTSVLVPVTFLRTRRPSSVRPTSTKPYQRPGLALSSKMLPSP